MASAPLDNLSPRQLMTLGMFVFGMDTLPYQSLLRSSEWRHGGQERHMAREANQFLGPGPEAVTITGLLVPEVAGDFGSFETLRAMADTGDDHPLMDGIGRVLGDFVILRLEEEHRQILAGGLPRQAGFTIELKRVS
ncbi:phage tail protein [Alteraurantiacibacter buctensis]|nr:phage tail protein [Alteraurantiacibacter buctensis]